MACKLQHWFRNNGGSRLVLALVGLCLVGCVVGPLMFWGLKGRSAARAYCPPCFCDCQQNGLPFISEIIKSLSPDCDDPHVYEETVKSTSALVADELKLLEIVANETMEYTLAATGNFRRTFIKYKREAEKCNTGMEICEEARARAQAELRDEIKLTALWERRARGLGWKDHRRVYTK